MAHILRLGYQGIEYMTTGRLTLPMPLEEREYIRAVRTGDVELNDAMTRAGEVEKDLKEAIETSPLSKDPDYGAVNRWLIDRYRKWWHIRGGE